MHTHRSISLLHKRTSTENGATIRKYAKNPILSPFARALVFWAPFLTAPSLSLAQISGSLSLISLRFSSRSTLNFEQPHSILLCTHADDASCYTTVFFFVPFATVFVTQRQTPLHFGESVKLRFGALSHLIGQFRAKPCQFVHMNTRYYMLIGSLKVHPRNRCETAARFMGHDVFSRRLPASEKERIKGKQNDAQGVKAATQWRRCV